MLNYSKIIILIFIHLFQINQFTFKKHSKTSLINLIMQIHNYHHSNAIFAFLQETRDPSSNKFDQEYFFPLSSCNDLMLITCITEFLIIFTDYLDRVYAHINHFYK